MSWIPIGPGFVFYPRTIPFSRISARNEYGLQALVSAISVSPLDEQRIYVVSYFSVSESAAFATTDGGATWRAISDSLREADSTRAPSCVAAHPTRPQSLFLGTQVDGRVHTSDDGGQTWTWASPPIGAVRALLVEPRASSSLATTSVYAATDQGLYYSADGGQTFTLGPAGDARSLTGYFPASGTAQVYGTIWQRGLYYSTTPGTWQLLNGLAGTNLPAAAASGGTTDFQASFVDYCPRNPGRVYLWLFHGTLNAITSAGLYVSNGASPLGAWTAVSVAAPPDPLLSYYGYYAGSFAVAPNSPGDGAHDILFFNGFSFSRSIDSGAHWAQFPYGSALHPDGHALDFFPDKRAYYPGSGAPAVPRLYAGTDGGLEKCVGYADPALAFGAAPTAFDEGDSYDPNLAVPQNLNQGRFSSRLNRAAVVSGYPALGYIGCTDTGVAGGTAAPGWHAVYGSDSGIVAAGPGSGGLTVWTTGGAQDASVFWTSYYLQTLADSGAGYSLGVKSSFGPGTDDLVGTSNLLVGLDGKCLTGIDTREDLTTLPAGVAAAGTQVVTPASMAGISVGTFLGVDLVPNQETIVVSAPITATSFTAHFRLTHAPGVVVRRERTSIARIDPSSAAVRISQPFGDWTNRAYCVAAHPTNADILYCVTADQRIWSTLAGSAAGPGTVWSEAATGRPAALAGAVMPVESTSSTWTGIRERATTPVVCSLSLDVAGNVYVLLSDAVTAGGLTTPLFQISAGAWVPLRCSGLPDLTQGQPFSSLAADPISANLLYATRNHRVFVLTLMVDTWSVSELTDDLPGSRIHDLFALNAASPGDPPRIVLRAATAIRGQWEREVTAGASAPAHLLYLRDNHLDSRWFNHCPDFAPDPFAPGQSVYHWQCEDIKVDVLQAGGGSPYYQSDPEGATSLSATQFDVLQNASESIPQGSTARVSVRVQNGGSAIASAVKVWVLYCKPGGVVPGLDTSPSMGDAFPFWNQFTAGGDIGPALPSDSPWHQVAPPSAVLPDIPPGVSQVATFDWMVPAIAASDDGHYCLAAFVTSPDLPLSDTSYSVDEIVVRAKQVGQKNVHIGPPLLAMGMNVVGGPGDMGMMRVGLQLNNPTARALPAAAMEIDLTALPKQIELSFRLDSTLKPSSITGATPAPSPGPFRKALKKLCRIFSRSRRGGDSKGDLSATRYVATGGSLISVQGLQLVPRASARVELVVRLAGALPPASRHVFVVRQLADGKHLAGGGTYIVRIAGKAKQQFKPLPILEDHSDID